MRGIVIFFAVVTVVVLLVACVALVAGASVIAATLFSISGAIAAIIASIIVNTHNAVLYGRQVWDESVHSDFIGKPSNAGRRRRVRRGVQDRGLHAEGIVR